MMIDRLEGNSELKTSVRLMLGGRRMTHSVLLVGEEGLGTGFAARCVAADYLYPNGGAPPEKGTSTKVNSRQICPANRALRLRER